MYFILRYNYNNVKRLMKRFENCDEIIAIKKLVYCNHRSISAESIITFQYQNNLNKQKSLKLLGIQVLGEFCRFRISILEIWAKNSQF